MTQFSLPLDKVLLSKPTEMLRLKTVSTVVFQDCQNGVASLDPSSIFDLFSSGKLWVKRGNGCRLDFKVLPGNLTLWANPGVVGEVLGRHIFNAPWWCQIPLSPSFNFGQPEIINSSLPKFAIGLNHNPQDMRGTDGPDVTVSSTDMPGPPDRSCLRLERIEVVFEFRVYNRASQPPSCLDELMLFNDCELPGTPGRGTCDVSYSAKYLDPQSLCYSRSPHEYPVSYHPSYSLLSKSDPVEAAAFHESDELLLCQDGNTVPPTPSRPAEISRDYLMAKDKIRGHVAHTDQLKASSTAPTAQSILAMHSACELVDSALCIMIGGRQIKKLPNIRLLKPYPDPRHSLAGIAPLLWGPGFPDAMLRHVPRLPTILNVFSNSLLRNVQSPSLRRKILSLATPSSGHNRPDEEINPREAVESELWRMLHISLFDPVAARRLQRSGGDERSTISQSENNVTLANITERGIDDTMLVDQSEQLNGVDDPFEDAQDSFATTLETDVDLLEEQQTGHRETHWTQGIADASDSDLFGEEEDQEDGYDDLFKHEVTQWTIKSCDEELLAINNATPPKSQGYGHRYSFSALDEEDEDEHNMLI